MKIIWSPLAINRTAEIVEYISKDKPTIAQNWVEKIFEKVNLLKSSPELGRIVPETKRKDVRKLLSGNYRIIYRIEKTNIFILSIRHGKQILPVDEIEEM